VAKLVHIAKRRPLTQQEQDKLMRELAMMRMVCDTNFILDPDDRVCPKLDELEKILEECRENSDVKVLVFSEWERMLELARERCQKLGLGYAYHTGSVPQKRRRGEILLFKSDPACRVFLTTDSGATGLNLQNASVVINCDLPWNPAKLEQRIARAWRKHQVRPVTVIHLVSEGTIEHKMLSTLASKQALADGVLDLKGDLRQIQFRGGRQGMLARLQQLLSPQAERAATPVAERAHLPADRALAFSLRAKEGLGNLLVKCQEHYPKEGAHSVLVAVVEKDPQLWQEQLRSVFDEFFGDGKMDPLAPVRFQVIDRATSDALQRLTEAGLIASTTRAVRELDPASPGPPPLSDAERQKVEAYRSQAARKYKMAQLLLSGDLLEEARDGLTAAALALGKALALEQRLDEPESATDFLTASGARCWGTHTTAIQTFLASREGPLEPALGVVREVLKAPRPQSLRLVKLSGRD
jgi:hypothetical protein